jgi:hypothetical protein
MTANRVVAVLTPLVFAPLAGASAAWLAKHVPGAKVSSADLQEIFIGGALIAVAPALQWLHGWQKYEARQAEDARIAAAEDAQATAPSVVEPEDEEDDGEDEAALEESLSLEELLALAELDEPLVTDGGPAPAGSEA